ncbi:GTP-binding protein [Candidatus Carsonella ruddii]|uniref:GTP-binding protein n=1 Tax=Carsonella ruddii TaxID=114186 RepID=UPI003D403C29
MKKFYIEEFISIKELVKILEISEIEFIKLTFLKGIVIKKNEILKFETVKNLCKILFNYEILKKNIIKNININLKLFFYISIIGNVNSGKTTLMDFIFKNDISLKETGKITQTVNILETYFYEKKIFFFDLPGHKLFNKVIETYINFSNIIFLIISIENEKDNVYENVLNIIKKKNLNLIICINKIDKNKNKKFFFEDYKICRISSKNGFGIKKLIKESINYFLSLKNINYIIDDADGIIVNSYYENSDFITTVFLLKREFKAKNFFFFKNEKVYIEKFFINEEEKFFCISPCIIKIKNVYFPIDFFFSIKKNDNFKIKEVYREKYFLINNYYIKSDNHTIGISVLDFYNNLKTNNKINIKISLGNFTEKDLKYCENFKCKIILINSKISNLIKKKIINKNFFFKEFFLINDLIEYFNNEYNLNKNELITGELLVKEIFPCGKNKKIAGCLVVSGYLNIENTIKIYKELKLIFQGKINTLKIKNNSVESVKQNEECGINIKNFNDVEIGLKIFSIVYV